MSNTRSAWIISRAITDDYENEPYGKEADLYDGGFPVPDKKSNDALVTNSAIIHECGHCCLALPDLYGYPVKPDNVFLKDENGNLYAGTDLLPAVGNENLRFPPRRIYLAAADIRI